MPGDSPGFDLYDGRREFLISAKRKEIHDERVRGVQCRRVPQGESAIQIARKFGGRQKNSTGEHFWARGYFVSTVGLDENIVRAYIRNQEEEDERYDQMKLAMG